MPRKRVRSNQKNHQEMGPISSDGGPKTTDSQPDPISGGQEGQKITSSLFNVPAPGMLVGLAPKSVLDYDLVQSPTSPLDFKIFSNLGSSLRFTKPNNHVSHQKCWECDKVGLGILDYLGDDVDSGGGVKTVKPSNSCKNIMFGPQIRNKTTSNAPSLALEIPMSLPKDNAIFPHKKRNNSSLNHLQKGKSSSDVFFEIVADTLDSTYHTCRKTQSFSLDSKRIGSYIHRLADNNRNTGCGPKKSSRLENASVVEVNSDSDQKPLGSNNLDPLVPAAAVPNGRGSNNKSLGSLSASEIELSEDYTRVIYHGPNPKTTHIFGDCVLESRTNSTRIESGPPKVEENVVEFDGIPPVVEQKSSSLEFFQPSFSLTEFLSFCYFCHKKLEEGKDIYMYRGEKAFCSLECRLEEILIEEGKEKSTTERAPITESPPPLVSQGL